MSILYREWKEDLMQGGANTSLGGTFRAIFMDTGASTVDQADEFFSNISATHGDGGTARGNGAVITPTIANANVDATDTAFTSVNTGGVTCEAIVAYIDSGVDATSHLVAAWDSGGGMPFQTTVGTAITIQWHASGLFDL